MFYYLLSIVFLLLPQATVQVGFIQPLSPLQAAFVNTKLPSIYHFNFTLASGLRSDGLIRIKFSNYDDVGTPTCLFDVNPTNYQSANQVIKCEAIGNLVYIHPERQLSSEDKIVATVFLSQPVPDVPGYTELFEVATVSSTAVDSAIIFDINPGYGNFVWESYDSIGNLFIELQRMGTKDTVQLQGAENSLRLLIRFNKGATGKYSRLVVLLDMPWKFIDKPQLSTEKSPLYQVAVDQQVSTDLYVESSIYQVSRINDQLLEIYFAETIVEGREFILNLDGILNPNSIQTGYISFYSTDYASDYVLEFNKNIMLQTSDKNLDINIELATGIPFQGPVQLYKDAEQYLKISFTTKSDIPEGTTITYDFSQETIPRKGTFYIYPSLTAQSGTDILYSYSSTNPNGIVLTNIGAIKTGTIISIQLKVKFSKIRPQFYTTVSILQNGVTIQKGVSAKFPLATNANSVVTFLGDTNKEANVIEIDAGKSTLVIGLNTVGKIVDVAKSSLSIYLNKNVMGSTRIKCDASNSFTFTQCSFSTQSNYNQISIGNIPADAFNINLTGLQISSVSNHQQAIYELYMRFDKDGGGSEYQDLMVFAFVRPKRDALSNFNQFHINNSTSNNLGQYPSFLRMFGAFTDFGRIPLTDEVLTITVYGLSNTLNNIVKIGNEQSFPCGSNLNIECKFIEGIDIAARQKYYPLDWDRVIIKLDKLALKTAFNIYIPQFFIDNSQQTYEFMVGTYNTKTGTYSNLQLEPQYTPTPSQDLNFIFTKNNATQELFIDLKNQRAGVLVSKPSSIPISFVCDAQPTPPKTGFGASTVLVTAWEFWNENSKLLTPTAPLSLDPQDVPVFVRYTTQDDGDLNAVIWPMKRDSTNRTIIFQSQDVEMPYSLDIPNYVMYTTDEVGDLYRYNLVANTGRNALSKNTITDFTFKCKDMIQNFENTDCTISFKPNAKIDRQSKMKVQFSNAFVTVSQCTLSYPGIDGSTIQLSSSEFSCESSLNEIRLSFNLPDRLPSQTYTLSFLGFDHRNGTSNSVTFTIFDANFGYVLETASIPYILDLQVLEPISIDDLKYQYQNLDSISNLGIGFTLPRDMYSNEVLEFDIGADLQGNNKNTKRLAVFLASADNSEERINIYGALKNQILRLQFDEGVLLKAGSYVLNIDNLRTPSTHSTDQLKIRLRRETDSVFVLETNNTLFSSYPSLSLANSAQIKLKKSSFMCVGCLGELQFTVTLTKTYFDINTILFIHFPSFFLPSLANDEDQLECMLNTDPVNCHTDPDYPFRLAITESPANLKPGDSFDLTIYGFVVPNGGIAPADKEDIFFAISTPKLPGFYSEQTFLSLPNLFEIQSEFSPMFFYSITPSNTTIKAASDYVLRVNTSAVISAKNRITVTFTEEYTNLKFIDQLSCSLNIYTGVSGNKQLDYADKTCSTTGNTIIFSVSKNIPGDSSLELIINKVPNPVMVVQVDPNQFLFTVFPEIEDDVIAISRDSLNSVYPINFIDPMNFLEANSNKDVTLTRGTYSGDIQIGTIDNKRFIQDISIPFSTAGLVGFTFLPDTINFAVGDTTTTFKVGCDENVKLRTYPLNFAQTQDTALFNAYGDIFSLRITVTDDPINIDIPATISVPLGGSSLPYPILLQNATPYKNMQILIDYDESNGAFGIDEDYSSPTLNFTLGKGLNYLAFFATGQISQPFYVQLELDGDNFESYSLSRTVIEIKIDNSPINPPAIRGENTFVGKTHATFTLTPSTEGMLFYQLSQPCIGPENLDDIKNMMKNNSFNQLEITQGCYQRYDAFPLDYSKIPYPLDLDNLTPETTYNLYIFYENKLKQNNVPDLLTFTFTTKEMDQIIKMGAEFSQTIFIDQLNDLICVLLKLFETRVIYVVDAQGFSCSNLIEPTSRYLSFKGASYTDFSTAYTFYLLPDPTIEDDASSVAIPKYFNKMDGTAKPEFYAQAKNYGIDFLKSFRIEYSFTQKEAYESSGIIVMPKLLGFRDEVEVVELNGTIKMTNIQLSTIGSVYALARAIGTVAQDPEDDFATIDVTTRIPRTPTNNQIKNCLDWNDEKPDACAKAVFAGNNGVDLLLKDLKPNTAYIVYYTVANEYPIEPIFSGDIQSFTVQILSAGIINSALAIIIAFIICFAI